MNRWAADAHNRASAGVLDDAQQVIDGIQVKEVPAQDVTIMQKTTEPQTDALRALFIHPEVRQAAARSKHVANGDDVVGGVSGSS